MEKSYEPSLLDQKWQRFWEESHLFHPETALKRHPQPSGKSFTIVMPPPNVTGILHQGHALILALEDTLTRWHRMLGDKALYLPGTDHASIAVNMQVVKHLASQGTDHRSLGREGFLEECWKWIRTYQPRIYEQIRSLGVSCDWSRVKFTMDPALNKSVTHAFVELYKKGLIYRAERLVNWCPKDQTGLSDLEVIYEERDSSLWHIRYPVVGAPGESLVVATTRPETLLGDVAVAVNPTDLRYQKFIGKKVKLPFVDREIPVVGDTFVDAAFGSGVVKVTPAHDHTDFEVGERHQLPKINVFTPIATIVAGLPGEAASFAGLDRFVARKKIVSLLEERGQLVKVEKHKTRVGLSERHQEIVEPFLSIQWYCKMEGMAQKAADSVAAGRTEFTPNEFKNQFMRWMENIHDWCISRQLWWGQQIPAWHCSGCAHIMVAEVAPTQCQRCSSAQLKQDSDVLDTWFSSALWPFSTLGWPDTKASDLKDYYPTQVLETGFDILFFWVARMLMFGLEFTGKEPFAKVYLHPMVRDEHGQKMSKTKGNVIDPLQIIKEHGADTLRLTLNALCVQGRDMRLSEERIEGYKHFINKVWNASKFVLMGCEDIKDDSLWRKRPTQLKHLHDRWILSRLDATARDMNKAWSEFRMQEAAELAYHFVWSDLCDWYLEAAKTTRTESRVVLLHLLAETLKLLHPLIPHVSEEIYHALPGVQAGESLSVCVYPLGNSFPDTDAIAEFRFVQDVIGSLRNLRAESKVAPSKKIKIYSGSLKMGSNSRRVIESNRDCIMNLAKLEEIYFEMAPQGSPVTQLVVKALEAGANIELTVPVSELVDLAEERVRLQKEVESYQKIVASQEAKLSNESFVARAPKEVIEKEKLKLSEAKDRLEKTLATLDKLKKS
jgi:valyl-tRNA synthetase